MIYLNNEIIKIESLYFESIFEIIHILYMQKINTKQKEYLIYYI